MSKTPPDVLSAETPPHSPDIEAAVLGCAMIRDAEATALVVDACEPADFHVPQHRVILAAIVELQEWDVVPDLLTLTETLTASQQLDAAGGAGYLMDLLDGAFIPHLEQSLHGMRGLKWYTAQRTDYYLNLKIRAVASDPSLSDALRLERIAELVEAAGETQRGKAEILPAEPWMQATSEAFGEHADVKAILGVPLGMGRMDSILQGGWLPGNLYIIAGNSGMGKTSAVVQCVQHAATYGHPCGIISLEMTKEQLGVRFQSNESTCWGVDGGVPYLTILNHANPELPERLDTGQCDQVAAAKAALRSRPMFIHDAADCNFAEITRIVRRMVRKHGCRVVFIDYLQIIDWDSRLDTNTALERITKQAKSLAKRENVAIVLLSQLTKENERRGRQDARPVLGDLRGSGAIRQNADAIVFLHRPRYYECQRAGTHDDGTGEMELIVAKNRQGPNTVVKLLASLAVCRFHEPETRYGEAPPANGRNDHYEEHER